MEKLSQLLNETTILDFKLLWKLSLRYSAHFFIAIAFTCGFFVYNYYQQPIIYAVNVPVKVVANHTVSHDLSALVPVDNANLLTVSELKISLDNFTFLREFAKHVIADKSFDELNLGATSSIKNLYAKKMRQECGADKECLEVKVANSLKTLFSIDQGLTENRFILSVNAIEKKTVKIITPILIKSIEGNRVYAKQYLVLKEIQSVGNLIAESRSIMQKMEGYQALEEQEKLQTSIDSKKEEIKMLQSSTGQELANFKALESRLNENKKSTQDRSVASKDAYESIVKNQMRLTEINQNIYALSNITPEKRSSSDNLIISQLTEERETLLKKLPSERSRRNMMLSENFADGQRVKASDFEFEYIVSKNKLEKLNEDFEIAKEELDTMLENKISNETKVAGMKTDLEFLRSLEAKLMSLKLLNATMTTDLYFEDTSSNASEFRQSSFMKIFMFSASLTFFLYFFSLLIRFLMDDRIYGEEEIRSHLKGLHFIGEVPKF